MSKTKPRASKKKATRSAPVTPEIPKPAREQGKEVAEWVVYYLGQIVKGLTEGMSEGK